jgi:hypothetical protein
MTRWLHICAIVACVVGVGEAAGSASAANGRAAAACAVSERVQIERAEALRAFETTPPSVAAADEDLLGLDEQDTDSTDDDFVDVSAHVASSAASVCLGRRIEPETLVHRAVCIGWSPRGPPTA